MTLSEALSEIGINATYHAVNGYSVPDLRMLVEEIGELAAALAGTHEHTPALELVQIGGIVANWLRQYPSSQMEGHLQHRKSA